MQNVNEINFSLLFVIALFLYFWGLLHLAVLREYSWHCVEESLWHTRRLYVVMGTKSRLATCKGSFLLSVILFYPENLFYKDYFLFV